MNGIRYTGARRGVFGLESWAPLRAPGQPETLPVNVLNHDDRQKQQLQKQLQQQQLLYAAQSTVVPNRTAEQLANSSVENSNATKSLSAPSAKQRLVAKYNYVANVDSPLGKHTEVNLNQFDKMTMVAPHPHQEYWYFVEMDDGRRGYVPANYVMPFEEKVTSLPWLANRVVEPLPPVSNMPYKPYKSAYDKDTADTTPANRQYFCEVCQKQLNGPQPYTAHMNSRAHREEVELAQLA